MKLRDKLTRLQMPGSVGGPAQRARERSAGLEPHHTDLAHGEHDERHAQDLHAQDLHAQEPHSHAEIPRVDEQRVHSASDDAKLASAPVTDDERLAVIRNLRNRLEGMRMKAAAPPSPARAVRSSERAQLPRVAAAVQSEVPGTRSDTPLGPLYRVVVTHDEDHRHGSVAVAPGCRVCPREVALLALDSALEGIDFSRALYLDTETTGLAGGTGTLPFLIGMAWFEGERLVVEQLLLQRPGLEAPMLRRLAERLALASVVVSYNGKSFDWPLLRTRFILNRIAAPRLPAHLDLLHCARRVYKSRLGSVRLIHLEQELMGFERIGDIPGELIPETYLAFLRGTSPGAVLTPIVEHNRSDLIALPALLGEIVRRFRGEHRQDARDQLGFARVAARALSPERAIAFAHAAAESDTCGELAARALYLVGELKLRQGDLTGAAEAFEGSVAASASSLDKARAHLALAKLHEHKTKQRERALSHASETAAVEGDLASARRVARLLERLRKRERGSLNP